VNGGLAFGCNRAKSRSALSGRAVSYEVSRCEATRGERSRRRRRVEKTAARGAQHHAKRPGANSGFTMPKASGGLEPGNGCAIAGREAGRRAAHLLSREGVLDREKLRRVTAARWKRSRRIPTESEVRAPRKCAAPVSNGVRDRGVRGSVTQARGPDIPGRWSNRPPRGTRDPLKRSVRRETHISPVSEGSIPRSTRPAKSR
jgi:hypothetical protein